MKWAMIKRDCNVWARDGRVKATVPRTAKMYRSVFAGVKGELLTMGEVKKHHVPERFYDIVEAPRKDIAWVFGARMLVKEE